MKRIAAMILTACLALGALPAAGAENTNFTDVEPGAYYAEAVRWAVGKGITSGTSETTFSPEDTCNRAQIITFLWRANGSSAPQPETSVTDVQKGTYYEKAVLWGKEKELFTGNAFQPEAPCTRAMAVDFLWRASGKAEAAEKAVFADIPASGDLADAVAWAVEQGVTSGTSETTFSPQTTCTRGQIVTFLHRASEEQGNQQTGNQGEKHPSAVIDISKIKGLYRNENKPECELNVWFNNPRLCYTMYYNSEKYGKHEAGNGFTNVVGNHAFADGNDGSRIDIWVYPDYLMVENSGVAMWSGKYILVDEQAEQQEKQQRQEQQEQKNQQMAQKYPASNVNPLEIDGFYRLEDSQQYQIHIWHSKTYLSFTLEDRVEEDVIDTPHANGFSISGNYACFYDKQTSYRMDLWFYPDYLILEFSGEGAETLQHLSGKYNLTYTFQSP